MLHPFGTYFSSIPKESSKNNFSIKAIYKKRLPHSKEFETESNE
jgi:hypothetical protein